MFASLVFRTFVERLWSKWPTFTSSIVSLLIVYYLWHRFERPSLSLRKFDWDTWDADRRYYIRVKNKGRTTARGCKAKLFMVIRVSSSPSMIGEGDKLVRIHENLGWLPIEQNDKFSMNPEDLVKTRDIPGRATERIWFGYASRESMRYSYPPSLEDDPSNEHNAYTTLELVIKDEPDQYYQELFERFLEKEAFFPTHHVDLTNLLENGKTGGFIWEETEIKTAEVRVTAKNTSLVETQIHMDTSSRRGQILPRFHLGTIRSRLRTRIFWNRLAVHLRHQYRGWKNN